MVRKDQLLYCRSIYNWGVCPKISIRQRLFNGKQESCDRITPSTSLKAHGTILKLVKERVRPEGSFRSVNLISVIFVRPGLRRCHERSLCNKKDAPAKQRGTWPKHSQAPQKYASSFIARKALRRTCILLRMDQRSKTTSHLKRYSNSVQHGELRSDRGSWFVIEFFLQFSLFNIHDTFKAGN